MSGRSNRNFGFPARFQRLIHAVSASGWPARLAYRAGFQRNVVVREYHVIVPTLPVPMPALRIAFASDLHAGPMTHPDLLEGACQAICACNPDLLLLGGDYVSFRAAYIDPLAKRLAQISTRLGKFAVLGNHDLWSGPEQIIGKLEGAGIRVLTNDSLQLSEPFDLISICGLDDGFYGAPDPGLAFDGADGCRIVLMHSPSGLVQIGEHSFSLALCGHTHGGQIALPGGVPILLPRGALCRRFPFGRFQLNNGGVLIVSRGIGCSAIPFRTFCPSEIVICNLSGTAARRAATRYERAGARDHREGPAESVGSFPVGRSTRNLPR